MAQRIGVQRVRKDGQGAVPVVLDDSPAERLVLRIEHARVPGTCPQGELLVLLHQDGEADHVGEHHRCQLPVQVLTHRDGPLPDGEWRCTGRDPLDDEHQYRRQRLWAGDAQEGGIQQRPAGHGQPGRRDHGAVSNRVAQVVEDAITAGEYAGAAVGVTVGGRLVVEHYAGEAAPRTPASAELIWPLASISKCFTAAMVMSLAERGDLSLETRVHDLLPRFRGDGREEIRVRHLLGHTSGLRYESPRLEELLLAHAPLSSIIEDAIMAPPLYPAGARFSYSDDAYLLAGLLAEIVTGDRYPDFVQSLVIEAMGLGASSVVPPLQSRTGSPASAASSARAPMARCTTRHMACRSAIPRSASSTALRDMIRFVAHFAPGGPRIHRDATVSLLTTPQPGLRGRHILRPDLGDDVPIGWGLAFEVEIGTGTNTFHRGASVGAFGHPGASGCRIVVEPATATTAVVLTNTHLRTGLDAWVARLDALTDAAFEDARAAA